MMPFGATSYNVLGTFDDSTAQFVAFDERVRCYHRRSRQTNPGNAKKVVKENCAFKQCDSGAGTTMWTISKTRQTSGKSAILNPAVRIAPVGTEAADLDACQSGYRRRAFTFGLITTCGNAPAVSGKCGPQDYGLILIIGRSKYRQLRSDTPTMTRRCAQQSL